MSSQDKRVTGQVFLLAIAMLFLNACGNGDAPVDIAGEKPRVALIMKSLANEFFVNMADGARQHQADNPDQYELVVNGLKDESDLTQQVTLIEQMIALDVDVIVLAPADSKALIPAVKRAVASGVVVINIDNKLDSTILGAEQVNVPFVGPDNRCRRVECVNFRLQILHRIRR